MAELTASMPPLPLKDGMQVVFEAIDPTSGAPVSGVRISNATLYVREPEGASDTTPPAGPFMLVPGPE